MTGVPIAILKPRRSQSPWRSPRNLIVPCSLALLAAMLTFVAMREQASGVHNIDMRVVATSDPLDLGATTRASIELTNRGERDVRPRFSITWLPYPYYWRVVEGPALLRPRERATYIIESPDAVAAPHDGATFSIKVNDASSITYAISAPITIAKRDLPVVNPGLKMWTQRDASTGTLSAAGWTLYARGGDGDTTVAEPASVFGTSAVHLRVAQDGQPDPGGWSHAGLTQEIGFPEVPFDVTVLSQAPFEAQENGWPVNAFGIEISDARNGLIWILFQPTGSGDREYDLPNGHHIKVFDVPLNTWERRSIDLPDLYRRLNWAPSKKVTLKLFIAAASAKSQDIQGYIAGLSPVVSGGSGR